MATRRRSVSVPDEPMEVTMPVMQEQTTPERKWLVWLLLGLGALSLFWYKTKTWPVAALVNYKPIMRFQVDQELFAQGGASVVDNIITERLVRDELARLGINVSDADIDKKIEEIKASLGETTKLEDALATRGMTMEALRKQITLQMGVEKAVADKISIASGEAKAWVEANSSYLPKEMSEADRLVQAEASLRQEKSQAEIGTWVQGLKDKAKVWKFF